MRTTIYYWPDRCDIQPFYDTPARCLPYSRLNCLLYLLFVRPFFYTEVCLPHRKLGRFVNWFSRNCSHTSLIDDGLDTLRETPANVEPELFAKSANFYTFDYDTPLGTWLERFSITPVSRIEYLANVNRPIVDLRTVRHLIIESPPLGQVPLGLFSGGSDTLLILHSNPHKRSIVNFLGKAISGKDIAIEKSLYLYHGEIVVGESMVAVFASMNLKSNTTISVYLDRKKKNSLKPMIQLLKQNPATEIHLCDLE